MVHALFRALPAGLLACALLAPAAAFAADPPPPNIIRLEPKPMEGLRAGRAVVVKGKAGPDGHRFLVEGLTAMMPVTVLLRPVRQGQDVRLQLSKYAWNQPLREGETEGGILKFKIIDVLRARGREVPLEPLDEQSMDDALDALFQADGHWKDPPAAWQEPDRALEQAQFFETLQACVDRLPPRLGRIFLMREWLEMETSAICAELDITPNLP